MTFYKNSIFYLNSSKVSNTGKLTCLEFFFFYLGSGYVLTFVQDYYTTFFQKCPTGFGFLYFIFYLFLDLRLSLDAY